MNNTLPTNEIKKALDFSTQQIFAESYWENYVIEVKRQKTQPLTSEDTNDKRAKDLFNLAKTALTNGNSHLTPYKDVDGVRVYQGGFTKLSETMAEHAIERYEIIDYCSNQPAGFSAIVLKDKTTGEYTLSFRSTQYQDDFYRDALGADIEIDQTGFAYGQINEMQAYYSSLISGDNPILPANTKLNITGYSLGGHLAYAFYVLNPDAVNHVYTYNAAGIGEIGAPGNTLKSLSNYNLQLNAAALRFDDLKNNLIQALFGSGTVVDNLSTANVEEVLSSLDYSLRDALGEPDGLIYSTLPLGSPNRAIAQFIADKINTLDLKELKLPLEQFNQALKDTIYHNLFPAGATQNNTVYDDARYKLAVSITAQEFYSKPLTNLGYVVSNTTTDLGQEAPDIFTPSKFTALSGKATPSTLTIFSDMVMVSKSNLRPEVFDVFIEDQNYAVDFLGRLPMLPTLTKDVVGDFGNTHSLTLLLDSLRVLDTLHTLDNNVSTLVGEQLLSSSSNQHASWHNRINGGDSIESKSISNIVDSLYRLFNDNIVFEPQIIDGEVVIPPALTDVGFTRKYDYLRNVDVRDMLYRKQNDIVRSLSEENITIKSLYNANDTSFNQEQTAQDIYQKALQDNAEGLAYRYALREMNGFVVYGVNYNKDNLAEYLNLNKHGDAWYKVRAEILVANLKSNINNDEIYSGYEIGYGQIIDEVAYRKTNYSPDKTYESPNQLQNILQKPIFFSDPQKYGIDQGLKNFLQGKPAANLTIFSTDIQQPYYYPGSQSLNSQQYNDTLYNDYIFMSNRLNTMYVYGGHDTIETGNQENVIHAKSNIGKNSLTVYLNGDNIIHLGESYREGKLFYKGKELTGGTLQSDGYYADYQYENITYKLSWEGKSVLTIFYKNQDNIVNTTRIEDFNHSLGLFNLSFDKSTQNFINPIRFNLEKTGDENVYTKNAILVEKKIIDYSWNGTQYEPVYENFVSSPFPSRYSETVFLQEGNMIYAHIIADGQNYKAHINDVESSILSAVAPLEDFASYQTWRPTASIYFRPYDKIALNKNFHYYGGGLQKQGDDLLIKFTVDMLEPLVIKNYFNFDHSANTNIWWADKDGLIAELSPEEVINYDVLYSTPNKDNIHTGEHTSIYDSAGDDVYTSGTKDTNFIDVPITPAGENSSNDIYISGSGNNKFVFSVMNASGQDTIKNIKATDKVVLFTNNLPPYHNYAINSLDASLKNILNSNGISLIIEGNDLILKGKNTNFQVHIKDYFIAFPDAASYSGISLEDLQGRSYALDISDFLQEQKSHITLPSTTNNSFIIDDSSPINNLNLNGANPEVSVKKAAMYITVGKNSHASINIEQDVAPTSVEEGTYITLDTINGPTSTGSLYIAGFNPLYDTLKIENNNSNYGDIVFNKIEQDLSIRYIHGDFLENSIIIKNFYSSINHNITRTGIINMKDNTDVITAQQLEFLTSPFLATSSEDNILLDASSGGKDTIITSTGNNVLIFSSKFNDNITAGTGPDQFFMSTGHDIYHLSAFSGQDNFYYIPSLAHKGSLTTIQYDNSVQAGDIKLTYDLKFKKLLIEHSSTSSLLIDSIGPEFVYNIENYFSIHLADGTNILDQPFELKILNPEITAPVIVDPEPEPQNPISFDNIVLGTYQHETLYAFWKDYLVRNYLVFGAGGQDGIAGNNNVSLNGSFEGSILVGGEGTDYIYAGSSDIVMARAGDGTDHIYVQSGYDNVTLSFLKPNSQSLSNVGFKTVGDSLELYYSDSEEDKFILSDYWNLNSTDITIALNEFDQSNSSDMHFYNLKNILDALNINKNNTQTDIFHAIYADITASLLFQSNDYLPAGELASYYSKHGNFNGFSLTGAMDILGAIDNSPLLLNTGYHNPYDTYLL